MSEVDNVEYMLTTVDNPFSPFTQFDEWYAYDTRKGYHSLSFLARLVKSSDELSDADNQLHIDKGIEEIVREDVLGLYARVTRDTVLPLVTTLDS